jgi:hypothetical protein
VMTRMTAAVTCGHNSIHHGGSVVIEIGMAGYHKQGNALGIAQ